jgi:SAM-dependent methyltransferase
MSVIDSRFVASDDPRCDHFIFDLPPDMWSRPYEYAWAAEFVQSGAVVLDAACGICHPFKFYLSDAGADTYACDIDWRLEHPDLIRKDIADTFGQKWADQLPSRYFSAIHYAVAPLQRLPFPDQFFDTVFCISVLEHLNNVYNRRIPEAWRRRLGWLYIPCRLRCLLGWLYVGDVARTLYEFCRVLKPDGRIVLTFDYPYINLKDFNSLLFDVGLTYAAGYDEYLSSEALLSPKGTPGIGLYCFRAVLTAAGGGRRHAVT